MVECLLYLNQGSQREKCEGNVKRDIVLIDHTGCWFQPNLN